MSKRVVGRHDTVLARAGEEAWDLQSETIRKPKSIRTTGNKSGSRTPSPGNNKNQRVGKSSTSPRLSFDARKYPSRSHDHGSPSKFRSSPEIITRKSEPVRMDLIDDSILANDFSLKLMIEEQQRQYFESPRPLASKEPAPYPQPSRYHQKGNHRTTRSSDAVAVRQISTLSGENSDNEMLDCEGDIDVEERDLGLIRDVRRHNDRYIRGDTARSVEKTRIQPIDNKGIPEVIAKAAEKVVKIPSESSSFVSDLTEMESACSAAQSTQCTVLRRDSRGKLLISAENFSANELKDAIALLKEELTGREVSQAAGGSRQSTSSPSQSTVGGRRYNENVTPFRRPLVSQTQNSSTASKRPASTDSRPSRSVTPTTSVPFNTLTSQSTSPGGIGSSNPNRTSREKSLGGRSSSISRRSSSFNGTEVNPPIDQTQSNATMTVSAHKRPTSRSSSGSSGLSRPASRSATVAAIPKPGTPLRPGAALDTMSYFSSSSTGQDEDSRSGRSQRVRQRTRTRSASRSSRKYCSVASRSAVRDSSATNRASPAPLPHQRNSSSPEYALDFSAVRHSHSTAPSTYVGHSDDPVDSVVGTSSVDSSNPLMASSHSAFEDIATPSQTGTSDTD